MDENLQPPVPAPVLPRPLPPRNPVTYARHRQDVLKQITFPFVIGCVVCLMLAVLMIWPNTGIDQGRWASIALVWLILPNLLFALLFGIILAGFIYLTVQLIAKVPIWARQVQDFFLMLKYQLAILDDKLVEPFLRAHAFKSSAKALGREIKRKL